MGKLKAKCRGIDRNKKPCRRNKKEPTDFCKIHQYMIPYTEHMMQNLKNCSTCIMPKYLADFKTCEVCREIGAENREADREGKILCKYIFTEEDGRQCPNSKSENDYCLKHETYYIAEELTKAGKRLCPNYIRKCKGFLPDGSRYKRCEPCRIEANVCERLRKGKITTEITDQKENTVKVLRKIQETEFDATLISLNIKTTKQEIIPFVPDIQISVQSDDDSCGVQRRRKMVIKGVKNQQALTAHAQELDIDTDDAGTVSLDYIPGRCRAPIDDYRKQCIRTWVDDRGFCNVHFYMRDYTDDMMQSLTFCLGCSSMIYLIEGQVCETCLTRAYKQNANTKQERDGELRCKYSLCSFAGLEAYDGLCGNHKCYNDGDDHRFKKVMVNNLETRECVSCHTVYRALYFFNIAGDFLDICMKCREAKNYEECLERIYSRSTSMNTERRLNNYKQGAKRRGYSWELTRAKFEALVKGTCHYCGDVYDGKSLLGIDRQDNLHGYTEDNSVTCCCECNIMKLDHRLEDFLQYCRNIITHYPATGKRCENVEPTTATFNEWLSLLDNRNKKRAKGPIISSITEEQYRQFLDGTCHYCNNTNFLRNGLDRVNSDGNYDPDNIVPACSICNVMKMDLDLEVFLKKVRRIDDRFAHDTDIGKLS